MDLGIADRKAIVCGASKGLGRGCAEALAADGVEVWINARTRDVLEATAAEIASNSGGRVHPVVGDQGLDALSAWKDHLDALAVAIAHPVHQVVGGLGEPAGIQHEHSGGRLDAVHHVQQDQTLRSSERTRERKPRVKILDCPHQDFFCAQRLEAPALDVLNHTRRQGVLGLGGPSGGLACAHEARIVVPGRVTATISTSNQCVFDRDGWLCLQRGPAPTDTRSMSRAGLDR